jgi:hypothetical protein
MLKKCSTSRRMWGEDLVDGVDLVVARVARGNCDDFLVADVAIDHVEHRGRANLTSIRQPGKLG